MFVHQLFVLMSERNGLFSGQSRGVNSLVFLLGRGDYEIGVDDITLLRICVVSTVCDQYFILS